MHGSVASTVAASAAPAAAGLPAWRRWGVVAGAMLGLLSGFNGLYYATLPFFMLPIARDFGWGRADVSSAAVLSMLGVTLASPAVGRLVDRFGPGRVIGGSGVGLAIALFAIGHLPPDRLAFGALHFVVGVLGAATTMAGYLTVLPRWFDRRLGLALGLAGVGLGLGVAVNGWLAATLIGRLGWREAYAAFAVGSLLVAALALLLLLPRVPAPATGRPAGRPGRVADAPGLRWAEALQGARFWVLWLTTFLVPCGILGAAVHAPSLYADRGMTPQQAALGAGLAGLGAIAARIGVGSLLDRFFAPRIAAGVFVLGGLGLWMGSVGTSLPWLVVGSLLSGVAIGAEGDLMPFLVRRYFGLKAFGAIFGSVFAAYALGGVLGPLVFGIAFDRFGGYAGVMQVAAGLCGVSAVLLWPLGPYRFLPPAAPAASVAAA